MKRKNLLLFAFFWMILWSCKSTDGNGGNTTMVDNDMSLVSDITKIEDEVNRLLYWVEHTEQKRQSTSSNFPDCATVTWDTLSSPKKVVIDFGASPCKCSALDNKYRKGKITVSYTGDFRAIGTQHTITTENYAAGFGSKLYNYSIQITMTVVSSTEYTLDEVISFQKSSNQTVTRNATRKMKWLSGNNTLLDLSDDVFVVSGSGSGKDAEDKNYSYDVSESEAIKHDISCKWLYQGVINLSPEGKNTRAIQYLTCDSYANVVINGVIYSFNFLTD